MNKLIIADACSLVGGVNDLHKGDFPGHFYRDSKRVGNDFAPEDYFKTLPHLDIIPGRCLDYIYDMQEIGGEPRLYFRPIDVVPFDFVHEYQKWRKSNDLFDCLIADGSPQSYFELVIFRRLAGHFYLFWHACYNYLEIVTTIPELEEIKSKLLAQTGYSDELRLQNAWINEIDPRPTVEINDDRATVTYCTFAMWDGFVHLRETFRIIPPHRLISSETLHHAKYHCGVLP